ncbi:MAG: methyltransferase [Flavobacteriaceae bacterium]
MESTLATEVPKQQQLSPTRIMDTGMGFWASKVLLTAVNIGLFTRLGRGPASAEKLKTKLGLHERNLYDFLDALVAMGFLHRRGLKETALYSNAPDADLYLDKNKATYIGSLLEMCNNRLYGFWDNLEDGLRSGKPQNEVKGGDKPFFEVLYADEKRLREYIGAMGGFQMENFMKFAREFDFSAYNSFCDIGGAGGNLATQVAASQPHMECTTFDLPVVSAIARENIERLDFTPRVKVMEGDFEEDDFPKADVIAMGLILHQMGTDAKKKLIKKAYDALPDGGALVVIENIIDDYRNTNAFGLLTSLNMLIETHDGYDFTSDDFDRWATDAGFRNTIKMTLTGPTSAVVAYK